MESTTSLTAANGSIAKTYGGVYPERSRRDSFGQTTASTGTVTNPFRYTAREFDPETELYYYRARYYDRATGRFTSEDPIGFFGGFDFYAYVHNNPPNLSDPSGLKVKICSRGGWQDLFPFGGVANHVYLLDTRTNRDCGQGNNSGKEDPSAPGTVCTEVHGSDGHEDEIMSCCETKRNNKLRIFLPLVTDCHNLVKNCVKKASLPVPTIPGGRWGSRCSGPECRPGPWKEDIALWYAILSAVSRIP
ncbi:MAG: RHS repeat-associated core domain-containing protein [Acidobacteria bacterium]|nr:RHS repeat-associated core domain-containing protein [Acidobacteriota bacterium]